MKLKNIYKNRIFRIVIVIMFCLLAIVIAVSLNEDKNQIRFIYHLYLIASISLFAIAYSEMANVTILGFGITRFEIYKKFNINLLYIILTLFIFGIYYGIMVFYAKGINTLNFDLILFLSFVIIFSGQLGMMFGNLRVNKYLSGLISILIFIGSFLEVYIFSYKLFINIILLISSIILLFINYGLIKNINVEKYL